MQCPTCRKELPPVTTTLPYNAGRTSTSHMPTLVVTIWPTPSMVLPTSPPRIWTTLGSKSASGIRKRSLPKSYTTLQIIKNVVNKRKPSKAEMKRILPITNKNICDQHVLMEIECKELGIIILVKVYIYITYRLRDFMHCFSAFSVLG